jgi:hypothetical protein
MFIFMDEDEIWHWKKKEKKSPGKKNKIVMALDTYDYNQVVEGLCT